jgi:endonuclease/exonuclease/phosphatase family metal-dependent hydrolase
MRAAALSLIAVLALASPGAGQDDAAPAADPPVLRVMSFNIRYATNRDHANAWPFRQELVPSVVRFNRADVVGMQEVLGIQMESFERHLPGYGHVATGREGRDRGERCAIFFRESRLELIRSDTFWLSPTPDKPSAAWGARLRRICTWAELKDRETGTAFFVFNTHFDHQSAEAREKSAILIRAKVTEIAGDAPVVLTGDLNCPEDSAPYRVLTEGDVDDGADSAGALRDAFHDAELGHLGPPGTFKGFGNAEQDGRRIDFVMARGAVRVVQHAILSHTGLGGRTPSDHRAVVADVLVGAAPRRDMIDLHAGWRFSLDPKQHGEAAGWAKDDHDDSKWERHVAGESWERQGHEKTDGIGWYRRWVDIPAAWEARTAAGERLLFEAHGIDDRYRLFLNGRRVAEVGDGSQTYWDKRSAVHLASTSLRYGERNLLVLRVVDGGVHGGLVGRPIRLRLGGGAATHTGAGLREVALVERQGFHVTDEASRRIEHSFVAPEKAAGPVWLRWMVGDGYDDLGDKGLQVRLLDGEGAEVWTHFQRVKHDERWERVVAPGSKWTLVIEDSDTPFGGTHPGNGGRVEVVAVFEPE